MKRYSFFLFFALLAAVSMACGSEIATATPTPPSAVDVGLTMIGDKLNAEATQAKFDSIMQVTQQVAAATATQQAVFLQATQSQQARNDAQATAAKHDAEIQATADQARRDAQATQQRIDADATQQAIHIQATQMRMDLEATQQAEGTARAWAVTQQVIPTHDLWTQQAAQKNILLATNEVELSNLKLKQQRDTNVLQWLVPMLIALALTAGAVRWALNYSRIREIKDSEGNTIVVIQDNQRHIFPKLMPGPVLEFLKGGQVNLPMLVAPTEQSEVTKRAQAIDALANMPERPTDNASDTFNKFFGTPQADLPFDIIDAEDAPPPGLLDSNSLEALNKDWKEAKNE